MYLEDSVCYIGPMLNETTFSSLALRLAMLKFQADCTVYP